MIDYEEVAHRLAQSIEAALFAIQNEGDMEKAAEILERASDFAQANDLL